MSRTGSRFALVLAACAVTASMVANANADPVTELPPGGPKAIPLKNAAMIVKTDVGYRYQSGQQHGHLTITEVDGKLLYRDTATADLRDIPRSCSEQSMSEGIAALCTIPAKWAGVNSMFLEVWPRLGDDFTDASTLSSQFRMWVLADAGNDTTRTGAGDDFVNGAQDNDRVWGGSGEDWLRTGLGDDVIWGEEGHDKLVGVYGQDEIHGGDGNDRVGGGPEADSLYGDAGEDQIVCGTGRDNAWADGLDRTDGCESIERS